MKIVGAIFDLDGTILDSMSFWKTLSDNYLDSLGIEPEKDLNAKLLTMSIDQSAAYLKQIYKMDKSEAEIIEDINNLVGDYYLKEVKLKDGVGELLKFFSDNCVKMCVATATIKERAVSALKRIGIEKYFEDVITCSEVGLGKTNPKIYNEALKIIGTSKEETYVFEDAMYALKTAKNAGFNTVGIYDESEENQAELETLSDVYLKSYANAYKLFM